MLRESLSDSVPLIPGFSPDPSICRVCDDYYLAVSSFDYFPGVPLFHSKDLQRWQQAGHVLDRVEQLPLDGAEPSGGIFAPTLRYHDGWFYLITTNTTHGGNFFVKTQDPLGDWSDPVWLPEVKGIDPDLFWDDDGSAYVNWSLAGDPDLTPGIRQAHVDLDAGKLLKQPRLIWTGTGGTYPEGPHLFRRGDWYYLCIAEGGTEWGHMQTIARSESARGPFVSCEHNPILTHRSLSNHVQCVGHADFAQTPAGEWFGVCHGVQHLHYPNYHLVGRETHIFPMRWSGDGWPVLADNGALRGGIEVVPGVRSEPIDTTFEDRFEEEVWPMEWVWLRNPSLSCYKRGDGILALRGASEALTSNGRPTWIGVRQRDQSFRVETRFVDIELQDGGEAGLCVYQSERFHAVVGVRQAGRETKLFTCQRIGSVVQEEDGPVIDALPLTLLIESDSEVYRLGWRDASGEVRFITDTEAKLYSVEVGGKFTGAMLGMYAQGVGVVGLDSFKRERLGL